MEYRPHIPRTLVTGSKINCADNSGAKELNIVNVKGYKGRLKRMPAACVGDMIIISVSKGSPDLRRGVFPAILIRQRKPYRRADGVWIQFEDNAAVIITPEGELRGSEIRGPVAKEAAQRWPRVAGAASMIV
ncbi:50S ribosomal protein L14 [Candidatus Bathyarchaeota archaeon]|nr:50S ribosomal protein L14 [Candidatus Bathyarchaeota archaeon]